MSAPSPDKDSVNACLLPSYKSVQYLRFKDVVRFVYNLGPDSSLWICDMKDAYMKSKGFEPCGDRVGGARNEEHRGMGKIQVDFGAKGAHS